MRVQITARHCDVPKDVLERTEELAASLSKFSPRASAVDVVFMEEKHETVAEVLVHRDGGAPIAARAGSADFRSALDQVVQKAGRQLRKQRERRTDHKAPPLNEAPQIGDVAGE